MLLGLRARIVLIAASVMLAAMGTIIAASGYVFDREYTVALQSRSLAIAKSLNVQLERVLQFGIKLDELTGFEEQCLEIVRTNEGISFASVVDDDGGVLFHSDPLQKGRTLTDASMLAALKGGTQTVIADRMNGVDGYTAIVPVTGPEGSRVANILVGFPADAITAKAARMVIVEIGVGLLSLAAGFAVLVAALSVFVTNPLTKVIGAIEQIRTHTADLERRLPVHSRDELGRLAETFNSLMTDLQSTTVSKEELERAMSELRQQRAQLEKMARHDALTGLPNRNLLLDRLETALSYAKRTARQATVIFIDLDNFKVINDSLGHNQGDALLKAIADRLARCVRDIDTVARLGGDEFVIVLFDQPGEQDGVAPVLERIQKSVAEPVVLGGHEYFVTGSIGFAIYPRDGAEADTLLRNADAAMYRAKEHGRNNFQAYSDEMHARVSRRLALQSDLRRALESGEFELLYQPEVDLRSGSIVAVEALIRWRHPERGLVFPDSFIPLAEETGLIVPIGEWVLRTACAQNKAWQSMGLPPIRVAVNLSARQFKQPDLVKMVRDALDNAGLEARYLELELTESLIMQSLDEAVELMMALRAMGLTLAIDDFGTGYSSLGALKRFPISRLKIAQLFIRDIPADPDSVAIARAVILLGKSMNLRVIAEGVETAAQYQFLQATACDEIQGYWVSRPVPAEEVPGLLERHRAKAGTAVLVAR